MTDKKGIALAVPALVLAVTAAAAPTALAVESRSAPAAAAEPGDPPDGRDGRGDRDRRGDRNDGGQGDGGQNDGDRRNDDRQGDDRQNDGGRNDDQQGDGQDQNDDQNQNGGQNQGNGQNQGGQQQQQVKQGPNRGDFADIRQAPRRRPAALSRGGSSGSFTSRCGRNENRHHNPDNFIVAPGVRNGAHHIHDYVGNLSTDGFSTDESLAAAGTTCAGGDKSTYFWPVMRDRARRDDSDQARQSAADGNVGRIVTPASARMEFVGNARSRVTAMPRFLRLITGDAKAGTNGTGNARAFWTCTGFGDRGFTDKYPLCPGGSRVARVLEFPSCWDGRNTDSANHRTHVLFPSGSGRCPAGTRAIPQLRMTLTYNLPNRPLAFAVDSFPEQGHDPVTDHADFENLMPDSLMRRAVACINSGRTC